jgi:hypothetical protein
METFGIWLAALLTIGIISFLYKDNILYKVCEAIFVGVSAAFWFVTYYWDNLYRKFYLGITDSSHPDRYFLWIAFFLGVLMLTRLFDKIGWLSRWPLAFIVGATAGLYMMIYFVSNAFVQVGATIKPSPGFGTWQSFVTYGLIWGHSAGWFISSFRRSTEEPSAAPPNWGSGFSWLRSARRSDIRL